MSLCSKSSYRVGINEVGTSKGSDMATGELKAATVIPVKPISNSLRRISDPFFNLRGRFQFGSAQLI
jgi:hypothetical protein